MEIETEDEEPMQFFVCEYYQRAFGYLHEKLRELDDDPCSYHSIRNKFWGSVPEGIYNPEIGEMLVNEYLKRLENEISNIISKNSIAYWIHLLRRILCTLAKCGDDRERPSTIGLVRCIFEASIQKYAKIEPCHRVVSTDKLKIEDILDGFFIEEGINEVEEEIIGNNQLVLAKFGLNELKEFYELENLVFEVWRSAATLRGINKGASLEVTHNPGDVFELRDVTLKESIKLFDDRHTSDFEAPFTAKGTLFELIDEDNSPWVIIPTYNVGNVDTKKLIEIDFKFLSNRDAIVPNKIITNFILMPFNLRNYYKANLYYSNSFEKVNKVNLESVIVVLAAILIHKMDEFNEDPSEILKYYQRGYEGPYKNEDVCKILENYLPICLNFFGFKEENINLENGMLFWTLTEEKKDIIDLIYPGPHSIFLPYGEDRLFIDYVWISRRLFDLFWNCKIKDENFKGTALELFIQKQNKRVLPTKPCKTYDGKEKQIDASFEKEDILLIVECKAITRSIAFDRGTKEALQFRKEKYNEAIEQVDEKAEWLIKNKNGTNFDISKYKKIIPIVITPFKEYIRTDERKYWLSDKIPRILTPFELIELIEEGNLWDFEENALFIE